MTGSEPDMPAYSAAYTHSFTVLNTSIMGESHYTSIVEYYGSKPKIRAIIRKIVILAVFEPLELREGWTLDAHMQ